jgi:hypothetical protein
MPSWWRRNKFSASSRHRDLNRSATSIPSACRIANIALNDAMILSYDANLGWMEFSERTGHSSVIELIVILSCFRHQIDACSQCADRPPNGIHQNNRRKQHNGLHSNAIVSSEIIKREKDATKK